VEAPARVGVDVSDNAELWLVSACTTSRGRPARRPRRTTVPNSRL
jgi:hypothetical protein